MILPIGICEVAKLLSKDGDNFKALELLTEGLAKFPDDPNLLLSRCNLNLKLRFYNRVLEDIELVKSLNLQNKCVIIRAKAFIGLGSYIQAEKLLQNSIKSLKKKTSENFNNNNSSLQILKIPSKIFLAELEDLLAISKNCLSQEQYGNYNFESMRKECTQNSRVRFDNCAKNFISEKICGKKTERKGRGLFAVEDIEANQLLLASKAFMVIFSDETAYDVFNSPPDKINKSSYDKENLSVPIQLIQLAIAIGFLLNNEVELERDYFRLFPGKNKIVNEKYDDDDELMEQIKEVIEKNGFSITHRKKDRRLDENSSTRVGIWIEPSFINHDCGDYNADINNIGDFMFVYAIRKILKGEEILISYCDGNDGLETRRKDLEGFGFECECRLCREQQEQKLKNKKIN